MFIASVYIFKCWVMNCLQSKFNSKICLCIKLGKILYYIIRQTICSCADWYTDYSVTGECFFVDFFQIFDGRIGVGVWLKISYCLCFRILYSYTSYFCLYLFFYREFSVCKISASTVTKYTSACTCFSVFVRTGKSAVFRITSWIIKSKSGYFKIAALIISEQKELR